MKLIKTKGHYYVLSDEKIGSHEIGDWVYETNNHIPVYQFSYDIKSYPLFRVLASTLKLGTLPLIDFYSLQKLIIEHLSKEHFPEDTGINLDMRKTWAERYINNLSGITNSYEMLTEINDIELNIELELVWKPISDFCDGCGSTTKYKPCDNICVNRTIKITEGYINIIKIN